MSVGPPEIVPSDARRLAALALAGTCVGLLFARRTPESYDAGIMLEVGRNLFGHGSARVTSDFYGLNTPYASYGIAMTVLLGGLYEIGHALGLDAAAVAMIANSLLFGLLVAVIAWFCRLRGAGWGPTLITAATTCLASPLLVLTATGFSELGVALGLALGLAGLQLVRLDASTGPPLVALGAMVALVFRSDSALLVVVPLVLGLAWLTRQRRAWLTFAVAAAPLFGIWLAYNAVRFGAPWRVGYASQPFNHPWLRGLVGLAVSPARGLVWYCPIVVVAAFGLRAAWRREPVLVMVGGAALLLRFVLYARWWGWYGGGAWGPRLVVPALPVLAVPLLWLVSHPPRRRWAAVVGGAVAGLGLVIQIAGAAVLPSNARGFPELAVVYDHAASGPAKIAYLSSPAGERRADDVLLRPALQPITGQIGALAGRDAMTDSLIGRSGDPVRRVALLLAFLAAAAQLFVGGSAPNRSAIVLHDPDRPARRRDDP